MRKMVICPKCGYLGSVDEADDETPECPQCGFLLADMDISKKDWNNYSDEQKTAAKDPYISRESPVRKNLLDKTADKYFQETTETGQEILKYSSVFAKVGYLIFTLGGFILAKNGFAGDNLEIGLTGVLLAIGGDVAVYVSTLCIRGFGYIVLNSRKK